MFFGKKRDNGKLAGECGHSLFQSLVEGLKAQGGVRAEDLIAAAASITGECCIEAAGDFNPRKHEFIPGSRVFSDKVNLLFSGDRPETSVEAAPLTSIVGMLRDRLTVGGYDKNDFPSLKMIFEHFAANIGKESDWGKVPLAVPDENVPGILPLRVAYETRALVDASFKPLASAEDRLKASVIALAESLVAVRQVIDRKIALLLALQTVNGMAKTAPMTGTAMKAVQRKEQ